MTVALNQGQLMALQLGRANDAGAMELHRFDTIDNVRSLSKLPAVPHDPGRNGITR